jgi:alkaline phosphatase
MKPPRPLCSTYKALTPREGWEPSALIGSAIRFAAACLLGALSAVLVGCGAPSGSGEARNAILVVGDGMGLAQRDAIQLASVGADKTLVMDSLPHVGLVGTDSADPSHPVTDSAAAGTAMASGVKTYNGWVGVDTTKNAVPTVLERAKAAGKAVGLVTTSSVTDATPAAFAAHTDDRSKQHRIAYQYLQQSKPDVILGGGRRFWVPAEGEDLTKRAQEEGYAYVTDRAALDSAAGPRLLGLFAGGKLYRSAPEGEGGSYDPDIPLREMTRKAIEVLAEDPDGFFLLVEEEAIDSMGHVGNATLMLKAGKALDQTVEIAKDFAGENGSTLLIVVGDHECCGVTIEQPKEGEAEEGKVGPFSAANSDERFVLDHSTSKHTAVDVPLTAMGPGAELLDGVYENTFIYEVMVQSMGLEGAN